MYVRIYVCVCVCIYIYIYIYIRDVTLTISHDQNYHGYQYYHGINLLKCAGEVQKVQTRKSLQVLYFKNQQTTNKITLFA